MYPILESNSIERSTHELRAQAWGSFGAKTLGITLTRTLRAGMIAVALAV